MTRCGSQRGKTSDFLWGIFHSGRGAEVSATVTLQELPVKVKEYEVARHSLFFNDSGAKAIYKGFVKTIVTRENTINGRRYNQDPTIMSWGLLNEPRCESWMVRHTSKPPT